MPASVCWSLHYAFEADLKKRFFWNWWATKKKSEYEQILIRWYWWTSGLYITHCLWMRPNINLTSFSWAKSQLLIGIVDSSRLLPLRAWLLSWTGRQVILCMLIAKQNNWRRLSGLFSLVAILKVPCVLQWPCISMTGVWARLCFSNIEMSWHIIMQSRCLSVHWLAHHSVAFSFLGPEKENCTEITACMWVVEAWNFLQLAGTEIYHRFPRTNDMIITYRSAWLWRCYLLIMNRWVYWI